MDTIQDTLFQDTGGRLLIMLLTAPLWLPIGRALWEEVNWMLRDEGGVFGPIPSERERAELLEIEATSEDPLVEEPILTPFERSHPTHTATAPHAPNRKDEPRGFARSGKVAPPTRFR